MSALYGQVGGNHYVNMNMQPMEFSCQNFWDAAAHTTLKYLSRYKAKNGLADLQKALHCLQMRWELVGQAPLNMQLLLHLLPEQTVERLLEGGHIMMPRPTVTMATYVQANQYEGAQAMALLKLETYVNTGRTDAYLDAVATLRGLIASEYPENE